MTAFTVVVAALALGTLAFVFAWGAPILAVPIALAAVAAAWFARVGLRHAQGSQRISRFRRQAEGPAADGRDTRLTDRDRETVYTP